MRLRYCACGAPVVVLGWRIEDERPTGRLHDCELVFGYDGGTPDRGVGRTCVNRPAHVTES